MINYIKNFYKDREHKKIVKKYGFYVYRELINLQDRRRTEDLGFVVENLKKNPDSLLRFPIDWKEIY